MRFAHMVGVECKNMRRKFRRGLLARNVLKLTLFAGPLLSPSGYAGLPLLHVTCERVIAPTEIEPTSAWIRKNVSDRAAHVDVFEDNSATAKALNEIGLPAPFPEDATMGFAAVDVDRNLFSVTLRAQGAELKSYTLQVPPAALWKSVGRGGVLDLTLKSPTLGDISFGTAESMHSLNRPFLSFSKIHDGVVTVTIGLDIECARFLEYSDALFAAQYAPFEGNRDRHRFCRVPVIRTHFPLAPTEPPGRRRIGVSPF